MTHDPKRVAAAMERAAATVAPQNEASWDRDALAAEVTRLRESVKLLHDATIYLRNGIHNGKHANAVEVATKLIDQAAIKPPDPGGES